MTRGALDREISRLVVHTTYFNICRQVYYIKACSDKSRSSTYYGTETQNQTMHGTRHQLLLGGEGNVITN